MPSPIIQRLPDSLINKIAAGEVIERPASVVKELLENALDAGSRDILVEVTGAGKDLIRVSDDGSGMGPEDLRLACERHATSKIREADDLFRVATMGFRGEALAAISSVSETVIETSQGGEGHALECSFGQSGEIRPVARERGTTITVKNLFKNVPVRKKFLKADSTEFSHIAETVTRVGLAWPLLRLRLHHNGKEFLHFPPQKEERGRIAQVLGLSRLDEYLDVRYEDQECSLTGVAGTIAAARKNWQGLYFFVNRRPVSGKIIFHALKAAYGQNLPSGLYPAGVYYLTINFEAVDVNVHPTKAEIRFSNESRMHQIIQSAVATALDRVNIAAAPTLSRPPSFPEPEPSGASTPWKSRLSWGSPEPAAPAPSLWPGVEILPGEQPAPAAGTAPLVPYFQVHDTYILCQVKSGIMIIDQHVAHERILYEWALDQLGKSQSLSQSLLFPLTMELEPAAGAAVQANLEHFRNLGFDLDGFGRNTIIIRGVPPLLKNTDITVQVREMVDRLLQEGSGTANPLDTFAKAYACGAAIKAGQSLGLEEMNHLVESLFQCRSPYACPHGRPVVVKLKLEEINHWFMRG